MKMKRWMMGMGLAVMAALPMAARQVQECTAVQEVMEKVKHRYTLSGYVYDAGGETMINATVWDATSKTGTVTNEHGFFSLTLVEGVHQLQVSYVGLCLYVEVVDLRADRQLEVRMRDDNELDDVVVVADLNSPLLTTQTGRLSLTASDLQTEFSLFSSPDVVKTLQQLPGVAAGTELVSGLYVHGGGNDQNLFLLDGTPLYQVNHLGGLFSAFNTDVVKNIDFYKSGFPARYGGRLSSVVDVRTNDGDMREYHGRVSVGLLDGRVQVEGPLWKDHTSFNVALRRTWLDVLTVPVLALRNRNDDEEKIGLHYAFYDLNAKVVHVFSERSRADLSFYMGDDGLKVDHRLQMNAQESSRDRYDLQWGNLTAALNWEYRCTPKLFAHVTGVYTRNHSHNDFTLEERTTDHGQLMTMTHAGLRNRSTIDDVGYRIDMDYRPDSRNRLRIGSNYLLHLFHPQSTARNDYTADASRTDSLSARAFSFYRGHELALYAEDDVDLTRRLKVNVGVHYTLFRVDGKTYHAVEPRASVRYAFAPWLTAKASYTEMSQFMHQLSNNYLNLPTDYWVPSTSRIRPMRSRQVAGGLYVQLPWHLRLDVEGFYKTMHHLVEYDGGNRLTPSADDWELRIHTGEGRAYGMEVNLDYTTAKTSATVAYTLAWNRRKFPDMYAGGWYADKFDNRHKLTLTARHKFTRRFEAYASWCYISGNRMTVPQQLALAPTLPGIAPPDDEEEKVVWVYERPNNVALPAYHRLDVGMNFNRFSKNGHRHVWNVSVYNVYNRMNALYGRVVQLPDGRFQGKAVGVFPIIPSLSYNYQF